jgi:hypothetical protein
MKDPLRFQPRSPRQRAAVFAAEIRQKADARCRGAVRRLVTATPGDPQAAGMAEFYDAIIDLVQAHVASEIEENVTWATPTEEELCETFVALFAAVLPAALDELRSDHMNPSEVISE